jgi:DNA-binding transcriptional MerR regulator
VRIGQLAARTGLTTKTIRFYESAGVLPAPARRPSGYRDYDEGAVDRLAFVKAAQAAGLSLAEIREIITVRASSGAPCQHVLTLLDSHAADLDRRIAELTALRADVERLRSRAGTLDPATCDPSVVCQVIPADVVARPLPTT